MNPNVFKFFFSGYIDRNVRKILLGKPQNTAATEEGVFNSDDLHNILGRIWAIYSSKALDLATQPNLRTTLVMNFACLTYSGFVALSEFGIGREDAKALIYQLTFNATSRSVRAADWVSKIFLRDQLRRMEILVDLLMRVVFCPPAYQTRKGQVEGGFFMDVHSCPVADYMLSQHTADLCVQTWCGIDFELVELIGGRLERSGTRAMGKEKCDFVFFVD